MARRYGKLFPREFVIWIAGLLSIAAFPLVSTFGTLLLLASVVSVYGWFPVTGFLVESAN